MGEVLPLIRSADEGVPERLRSCENLRSSGGPSGLGRVEPLRLAVMVRGIDKGHIPRHVAVVMDGNGRWATRRGLPRTDGHAAGEEALFDMVEGALEAGIDWLTVFAFSTENWRRPLDEVRFIMRFNEGILVRHQQDLHSRGVRVRFVGRRTGRVPRRVLRRVMETEELTRRNRGMTFTVAFNYGGRAELVDAARSIARDVAAGRLDPERVDERALARRLYAPDAPDVDLLIRTSGEFRISNFLLWELAYSELIFTETLWPDFRRADLFAAISEYQRRERRFGSIGED